MVGVVSFSEPSPTLHTDPAICLDLCTHRDAAGPVSGLFGNGSVQGDLGVPTMLFQKSLLTFLGLVVAAGTAEAQPSHKDHWSLEARIAAADAVVVGPIAKVNRKVLVPVGGRDKIGVEYPDGQFEYSPAVKIETVLKGNLKGVVDDLHFKWSLGEDKRYEQWLKAGNSMLWFLGPSSKPGAGRAWHAVVFGKAVPAEGYYGGRREPPMYAMDFTVLKDERAILARARQYAKSSTSILKTDTIRFGYPWNDLIVPVEPALEPLAKRLIASPQDFVPKDQELTPRERYQFRFCGIRLLRHFKSDANLVLLKSLLADPLENFQSSLVRQHPVRVKAFEVLLQWGVDAPLPKLPDEIDRIDLAGTGVTDALLKPLTGLKNLTWLDLSDTRVTDAGLKELAGMSKLGRLWLQNTRVTGAGIANLQKSLPKCIIAR